MRWTWILRGAVVAGIALAAVPLFDWWRTPNVRGVPAQRGAVAEVVYATGVVEPVDWAKVVPVVRGRVIDLCDCEGRRVVRGQVLGRLDDAEPAAQLAELIARQELTTRTYDRIQQLASRGVATAEQLDRVQAEVLQVRALISAQRERLSNYVLRAPIDGTVLRRDFHVGEIVGTSDVLFWVGQPRPLRIVAEVSEEDIALVAGGQPVLVRHEGFRGRRLEALVGEITPKGDPVQRSFRVSLTLPDDTPLRVGMSVEGNIVVAERADAIVVPAEAVRDGTVHVIEGDRALRRAVTLGIRGVRGVEIVSGLSEGERVVVPANAALGSEARVRVTDAAR